MDYTPLQIGRELRRLGVDEQRVGALAVHGITADALLRWLRSLPTDIGHDAFIRRLQHSADDRGLKVAGANGHLAAADPHYVDAEADELLALIQELDRVAPEREGGINFPNGRTRALAVLRILPTGAGVGAITAALNEDRDQMSNDR